MYHTWESMKNYLNPSNERPAVLFDYWVVLRDFYCHQTFPTIRLENITCMHPHIYIYMYDKESYLSNLLGGDLRVIRDEKNDYRGKSRRKKKYYSRSCLTIFFSLPISPAWLQSTVRWRPRPWYTRTFIIDILKRLLNRQAVFTTSGNDFLWLISYCYWRRVSFYLSSRRP